MRLIADSLSKMFAAVREVPICNCVHFCAYQYGRQTKNPYERFARDLADGLSPEQAQARFIEAVARYRPRNLGQALGAVLSKPYPLWWLPWRTLDQVRRFPGWVSTPGDVVDVMTYFAEAGIPRAVLDKESRWHQDAFTAIRTHGYQPQRHSYIIARELRGELRSVFLVTDGNHRLSALSALGIGVVDIKLPRGMTVHRSDVMRWPLVRAGFMTRDDALAIFDAYLDGNNSPAVSTPAPIIS